MKLRVDPTFTALCTVGLSLASNYLELHSRGLCYQDISFGNVFFDPDDGSVLICDNDNVTFSRQDQALGVLGTPKFMAPEVVRGEALPSIETDLFSLAVLLFYIFFTNHPLEGLREYNIKCMDSFAMKKLYGADPLFIFDPDNDDNRPVVGYHQNAISYWNVYPKKLKNAFIQSFTDGLKDPVNGRYRESMWRKLFAQLRDQIVLCSSCQVECFYDETLSEKAQFCWKCHQPLTLPPKLILHNGATKSLVLLHATKELYPYHLDGDKGYDFSTVMAKVNQHPTHRDRWGLTNMTERIWRVTRPDQSIMEVPPGKTMPLLSGVAIQFGYATGSISV